MNNNNLTNKDWINKPLDEVIALGLISQQSEPQLSHVPDDDTALFKAGHRRRLQRSRNFSDSCSGTSDEDEDEEERARYKRRFPKPKFPINIMDMIEDESPTVPMLIETRSSAEEQREAEPPAAGVQVSPSELPMREQLPQRTQAWYRRKRRLRLRQVFAMKEIAQNKASGNMLGLLKMPGKNKLLKKKKYNQLKLTMNLGGQWRRLDMLVDELPMESLSMEPPNEPLPKEPSNGCSSSGQPRLVHQRPLPIYPTETAFPVQQCPMQPRSVQPLPVQSVQAPPMPVQLMPLLNGPEEPLPADHWSRQPLPWNPKNWFG